MKLFEIDEWYRQNSLEDSWWVAVNSDVQGPLTLAQAGAVARKNPTANVSLLHTSHASENPPPWIHLEIEVQSEMETVAKTTMRLQISKIKSNITKKPFSSFKPQSSSSTIKNPLG